MKKLLPLLLAAFMVVFLAACSGPADDPAAEEAEVAGAEAGESVDPDTNGTHILVAYFSATGNTAQVADCIAAAEGCDLFAIEPVEAYTEDDLNYNSEGGRAELEMNDVNARPAIANVVENMDQYDVVFLGYPIWWGQAPKIMVTFLESYNFEGKEIIPFCTSGSSPIGDSAENLHPFAEFANWQPGQRFPSNATDEEVLSWIGELGLELNPENAN